jgi:hypothetical protein
MLNFFEIACSDSFDTVLIQNVLNFLAKFFRTNQAEAYLNQKDKSTGFYNEIESGYDTLMNKIDFNIGELLDELEQKEFYERILTKL